MRYYWGLGIGHTYSHGQDIQSQHSSETPADPISNDMEHGHAADSPPRDNSELEVTGGLETDETSGTEPIPNNTEAEDSDSVDSPTISSVTQNEVTGRQGDSDDDASEEEVQDFNSEDQDMDNDYDNSDGCNSDENDDNNSDHSDEHSSDLELYDTYEVD